MALSIVQAAAKGIIAHKNAALLKEHGGPIEIGIKWTESFLRRRGYVKRKATKAARKLPPNFEDLKSVFLQRIRSEEWLCLQFGPKTAHIKSLLYTGRLKFMIQQRQWWKDHPDAQYAAAIFMNMQFGFGSMPAL